MKAWDSSIEALFDNEDQALPGQWSRVNAGVLLYRTKVIRSGGMLEVCAYPVVTREHRERAARIRPTSKAQERVNAREQKRRLIRKAEANFSRKASFVTLTYAVDPGEEQAHKDLTNYLRRLKTASKGALKYIAVTEIGHNGRVHHHALIEGVGREIIEKQWRLGYVNARRYQHSKAGFGGLVRYMLKKNSTLDPGEEGIGKRRIRCSRGLKEPDVRISDRKLSRRRMQAIGEESEVGCAATLEKVFRGYEICEPPRITRSWYLPGAYLYAVLRRRE